MGTDLGGPALTTTGAKTEIFPRQNPPKQAVSMWNSTTYQRREAAQGARELAPEFERRKFRHESNPTHTVIRDVYVQSTEVLQETTVPSGSDGTWMTQDPRGGQCIRMSNAKEWRGIQLAVPAVVKTQERETQRGLGCCSDEKAETPGSTATNSGHSLFLSARLNEIVIWVHQNQVEILCIRLQNGPAQTNELNYLGLDDLGPDLDDVIHGWTWMDITNTAVAIGCHQWMMDSPWIIQIVYYTQSGKAGPGHRHPLDLVAGITKDQ
ncbi:hypothetical protein DFH07DRAFT_942737 [Mycena maculata]|uniref:Uncharacterized protein n=1 Tax=Mycena maculata TaxID=230809 RepID=A0AAD7N542_9AGAR|nr:hypothetical protein DFH07DRAFT_942737 [Mycena maculata]